jgi:quercetin dioxygenase-like cupin family protein
VTDDSTEAEAEAGETDSAVETYPSGYRRAVVDAIPDTPNPTRRKKELDEAVGATAFGFNLYEAAPGEQVPWGYHRHPDHEELFYVLSGSVVVETADGEIELGAGEALFVPPDAPNRARAVGEEPARLIAVGAPKSADDSRISEPCPACGAETDRTYEDRGDVYVLSCAACGAETTRFGAGSSET